MKKNMDTEYNNSRIYIVLIIIIVLFGIALGSVLIINRHKNKDNVIINEKRISDTSEYNTFFTIQRIISNFITSSDNSEVYNMLDIDYITKNNVSEDNSISIAKNNIVNMEFKAQKVKRADVDNEKKNIYIAKGMIIKNELESTTIIEKDYSALVLIDYNNLTFSIYPNIDDLNSIKDRTKIIIDKNDNNSMPTGRSKTNYDICTSYYNDFIFKINYLLDDAYELLDSNSKEKYTKEELSNIYGGFTSLKSCKFDSENLIYVATGDNDKVIRFIETTVMNYNVHLE